jgi:hypothetical protein
MVALFYKDEAGKMDKPNPMAANAIDRNSRFAKRQTFGAKSHGIGMIGRMHTDIFLGKLHVERSQREDKLITNNDAFCLMADGG